MTDASNNRFTELRQQAEALLEKMAQTPSSQVSDEARQMLHDLSVQRIELEIQNEELQATRRKLEQARDSYAQLYHEAPVGYLTLDQNARIIKYNHTFAAQVGEEQNNLSGHFLTDWMEPTERNTFWGRYRAFFKAPGHKQIDVALHTRPGNVFTARIAGRRITINSTAPNGPQEPASRLLVTITDISEQRKAEEKLLDSNRELARTSALAQKLAAEADQANQAKTQFLANMSHEIRTPLNGVIATADLLMLTKLSDEQQRLVEILHASGNILLTLVNDILDLAKIEANKLVLAPHFFNLYDIVDKTMAVLRVHTQAKHLNLSCNIAPQIPERLWGDSRRLQQVLMNLGDNAVKFTPEGQITLTITCPKQTPKQTTLRFEVQDTGIGIPQPEMIRLFEAFHQVDASITRKYGGTGLGLAISKRLVSLMGGDMGVESTEGRGSIFWFTVVFQNPPAAEKETVVTKSLSDSGLALRQALVPPDPQIRPPDPAATTALPVPGPLSSLRILLAEDNPVNQLVMRRVLDRLGFSPDMANDGQQVIARLKEAAFDLVLMDVQMPVMDGLEATRAIRSGTSGVLNPAIPIIALTAHAMDAHRKQCFEAGMNDYLTKPIQPADLAEKIRQWTAR